MILLSQFFLEGNLMDHPLNTHKTQIGEFLSKFDDLKTKTFIFISRIIPIERIMISVLDFSKFSSIWYQLRKNYKKITRKVDTQRNSNQWFFVKIWQFKNKTLKFISHIIAIKRILICLRFFKFPSIWHHSLINDKKKVKIG